MIRDYQTTDFAALSVLCREMHGESQYSNVPFSDERLFITAESSKDQFFKVSVIDDVVVGYMAGTVFPLSFSDYLVSFDHAMYVTPKLRKGGGGTDLIRSFISWSKAKAAKEIRIGISYEFDSTEHTDIQKLLKGLKFTPKGEWFKRIL